ncbi:MAG: FAD-binding protein [Elusimicrobiaceae bacterium]|nr:FAD-binding protein [Elusimicrobiaceae bacterium]
MINNNFNKAKQKVISLLGPENVFCDSISLLLNGFDGSPVKSVAQAVLNINKPEVLWPLINLLIKYKIPYTPRACGTNHDGAAVPLKSGVILNLKPLNKIEKIDTDKGVAIVQSGVINQDLQEVLFEKGYFFAGDPASGAFCTIGANAALNSGGAKTLKYGPTLANVLAADLITSGGALMHLERNFQGPDLLSLLLKSEGTLCVISRLWLKILPLPKQKITLQADFKNLEEAMKSVEEIIASGIVPSALEALDDIALNTPGKEASLLIELEGESSLEKVRKICVKNKVLDFIIAQENEAKALWAKRKAACSALARLNKAVISLDPCVARSDLAFAIKKIKRILVSYKIQAGIVFHAGDGNIHPNIVYDPANFYANAQINKAIKEIYAFISSLGASISAEHGIGIEKRAAMALMYDEKTLNLMRQIKKTLDPFNLANPDKILPLATKSAKEPYASKQKNILALQEQIKQANEVKIKETLLCEAKEILELDKKNWLVKVQAGCQVSELEAFLNKHKMSLPITSDFKGSIGKAFADGDFKTMADYVTELEFILPNGEVYNIGGKNIKNVAGYDIIRFLCGSKGAYALITALTIRVFAVGAKEPLIAKKTGSFSPASIHYALKEVFDPNKKFNKLEDFNVFKLKKQSVEKPRF